MFCPMLFPVLLLSSAVFFWLTPCIRKMMHMTWTEAMEKLIQYMQTWIFFSFYMDTLLARVANLMFFYLNCVGYAIDVSCFQWPVFGVHFLISESVFCVTCMFAVFMDYQYRLLVWWIFFWNNIPEISFWLLLCQMHFQLAFLFKGIFVV